MESNTRLPRELLGRGSRASPARALGQRGTEHGRPPQGAAVRPSVRISKWFGAVRWDCISAPRSDRPASRRLFWLLGVTLKSSRSFPNDSGVCCHAQVSWRAAVPALGRRGSRCAVSDLSGWAGYLGSHPKAQSICSKLKGYLQKAECCEYGIGYLGYYLLMI